MSSSTAGLAPIDVDDSLETLLARHPTRTHTVHLVTLAIVFSGLGAVALVSVDVTVRAPAVLRPVVERQTLRTMVDGVVSRVPAKPGHLVRAGDTILVMSSAVSDRAHDAAASALHDQTAVVRDLRLLLAERSQHATGAEPRLSLARMGIRAREARLESRQLATDEENKVRLRDRLRLLSARGFAAAAEVESAELELAQARQASMLALERRRAEWATELADAEQRVADLRRDVARHAADRSAYLILAPVAGTIDEIFPITPGSTMRAGDPVAIVSPEDSLVADVMVSPRDVARVRVGMPVRLLIEGYDVQEWGSANGVVTTVATDYTMVGEAPAFRVRVRPTGDSLRRPDGRAVPLKKGLRVQARFLVGRRRLTALLMRRASEWIDPSDPATSAVR